MKKVIYRSLNIGISALIMCSTPTISFAQKTTPSKQAVKNSALQNPGLQMMSSKIAEQIYFLKTYESNLDTFKQLLIAHENQDKSALDKFGNGYNIAGVVLISLSAFMAYKSYKWLGKGVPTFFYGLGSLFAGGVGASAIVTGVVSKVADNVTDSGTTKELKEKIEETAAQVKSEKERLIAALAELVPSDDDKNELLAYINSTDHGSLTKINSLKDEVNKLKLAINSNKKEFGLASVITLSYLFNITKKKTNLNKITYGLMVLFGAISAKQAYDHVSLDIQLSNIEAVIIDSEAEYKVEISNLVDSVLTPASN